MGKLRRLIKKMKFDLDFFIEKTIIRWYDDSNEVFIAINPSKEEIVLPEELLNKEVIYPKTSTLPILKAKEGIILK